MLYIRRDTEKIRYLLPVQYSNSYDMQLNTIREIKKCYTFGIHNNNLIYTAGLGISEWMFCFVQI